MIMCILQLFTDNIKLTCSSPTIPSSESAKGECTVKPSVALTSGNNRSENVGKALELIKDDISFRGKSDVFIKVNFVDVENQVAATHAGAVQALLEFIRKQYSGKITIGEATIQGPVVEAFEHFGYMDILREYKTEIFDMKEDDWEILSLYDSGFKPMPVHYSKRMLKSDYLISVGPPKTHDNVQVTLSIKNVVMGGPSHKYDDKMKIHQGPAVMNLDLYLMAIQHLPELAVIDGFVGMEGDGPVNGDPVEWKMAAAGCNAVSVDCLVSGLMGFPAENVGYLYYLSEKGYGVRNLSDMNVCGENPENIRKNFAPHPAISWQRTWPNQKVNELLVI
jgi:uncharacterized protein (DUF362 family)